MPELPAALLDTQRMYAADKAAIDRGVPGVELMENAGRAVVDAVISRFQPGPVLVLCGPGNNGGDGFVIARLLAEHEWPVRIALMGDRATLKGDAASMAERWEGPIEPIADVALGDAGLLVDALFGAGLTRGLGGKPADLLAAARDAEVPIVAVDMPSGVSGDTGCNLGGAQIAQLTVTFFRAKPGHYLMPGRAFRGELVVADIGIPETVLDDLALDCFENTPALWRDLIPIPGPLDHKYSRGHAFVAGGPEMLGAARLATRAAQRIGAGMVTLASPTKEAPLYRLALESAVVRAVKDTMAFSDILSERKVNAALIGPGMGVMTPGALERVLAVLRSGVPAVLDADALTLFKESPRLLFDTARAPVLITPHEGEFARLFPDIAADGTLGRLAMARAAAARSGFCVLLKGFDTVVADPSGRATITTNATPYLATAGSGDVLAGIALGLMAQGMAPFDAGAAAAWLHAEAGRRQGIGLIAEDLPEILPDVVRDQLS